MDRSVAPCENFYRYSCGGWIKNNPIPPDQPAWNVYAKLTRDNQMYLWGILEEAAKATADRSPAQRQIGDYFAACMDEPAVEKAGAAPLKPALNEIAKLKSINDLATFVARQHLDSQTSMMFGFGSNQDYADASRVIAFASAYEVMYNFMLWGSFFSIQLFYNNAANPNFLSSPGPTPWNLVFATKMFLALFAISAYSVYFLRRVHEVRGLSDVL